MGTTMGYCGVSIRKSVIRLYSTDDNTRTSVVISLDLAPTRHNKAGLAG